MSEEKKDFFDYDSYINDQEKSRGKSKDSKKKKPAQKKKQTLKNQENVENNSADIVKKLGN